jgi:hypothetical protein
VGALLLGEGKLSFDVERSSNKVAVSRTPMPIGSIAKAWAASQPDFTVKDGTLTQVHVGKLPAVAAGSHAGILHPVR